MNNESFLKKGSRTMVHTAGYPLINNYIENNHYRYAHIYIVLGSDEEDTKFDYLGDLVTIYKSIDELPKLSELKKSNEEEVLLFLDDVKLDKPYKTLFDLFIRSRQYTTLIVSSGSPYFAPQYRMIFEYEN